MEKMRIIKVKTLVVCDYGLAKHFESLKQSLAQLKLRFNTFEYKTV